ncbi:BspA family leucine-rich repeat surface protein, partial [Flavobacteriaceae bacterium]|nr:BspA family leucine-rich repeat surface protein [Flavobacteriaceae bacterium]
ENLEPNTTYYARTFLTNALGEFYGNEVSFLTSEEQLCEYNLITREPTNITSNSAILNGTIRIAEESCDLPNTEQGFVYSTEEQPTIEDTQVNVNGTEVTTTLENLEPSTTYYVRTFLTNELGEFYGNEVSFMTGDACDGVYLAENGITIKAYECAEIGDTGVINGVTYTIVDETMLRAMVANEEDVTKVCTSLITNMASLFKFTSFNQDISSWDVSSVTLMVEMFLNSSFNQDIGSWDVSNVSNMFQMFANSSFNQNIGNWDTSSVTNMYGMFYDSPNFNQPIGNWDVSSVTETGNMFVNAEEFNQDISAWDVSNVISMRSMFTSADAFNQPIGNWDVSNVISMRSMFANSSFNQNIGNWDTSSVTNMYGMFFESLFSQDISNWDVSNVNNCNGFSDGAPLTEANTPNFTNCTP